MVTQEVFEKARHVRLAMFDVDGVLTDGSLYISDAGEEYKAFFSLDGHGMRMLRKSGVELAIITGRSSRCVELRAQNLGIGLLYQGVEDKLAIYQQLVQKFALHDNATAYMGDDVVDIPILKRCGLAVGVPNAHTVVKRYCDYVTRRPGGQGAVREFCDLVMRSQNTFDAQLQSYLK